MRVLWFINAHKQLVSKVSIVEQKEESEDEEDEEEESPQTESENAIPDEPRIEWPDQFVLSCSHDCNILLHRLSNGVKIGQFGQDAFWNIFDMTPYEAKTKRPNYVREWIQEKKVKWRDMIEAKLTNSGWKGVVDPKQVIKEGKLQEIGLNASVDSVGNLSFNEDDEENSGRANEYEDYRGLDAAALEDSDDENISSAFKGALLKPEYTNKLRKDKNKVNDEFRY